MVNILDFGAAGDGETNDAPAIQRAVDACAADGGGCIYIPGGRTYRSGTIILKENTDLYLERGAVLKASDNPQDYTELRSCDERVKNKLVVPSYENCEYDGLPFQVFIYAKDVRNVSISGFGCIDGNEKIYYGKENSHFIEGTFYPRIPLLYLEHLEHLTIQNVTLKNSAFWTVHMIGCEDVLIDGIRILNNLRMVNSDGIDPDHCKNVRISNCHIQAADDCIVFKNTAIFGHYGDTENVTVTNCTLISTSAAIKLGTESENNFNNITIQNCAISRSHRGISIMLRDKGNVKNLMFSNISIETRSFSNEWWGQAEGLCITALDRKDGVQSGCVENVLFRDIFCRGENGAFLYAQRAGQISGVRMENVIIELVKSTGWDVIGYDLRPCNGENYIRTSISGVYIVNGQRVKINGLQVKISDETVSFYDTEIRAKGECDITVDGVQII